MSKDEAIRMALSRRSSYYRWKMLRNIRNALGTNMLERVMKDAYDLYRWSNYYSRHWDDTSQQNKRAKGER